MDRLGDPNCFRIQEIGLLWFLAYAVIYVDYIFQKRIANKLSLWFSFFLTLIHVA